MFSILPEKVCVRFIQRPLRNPRVPWWEAVSGFRWATGGITHQNTEDVVITRHTPNTSFKPHQASPLYTVKHKRLRIPWINMWQAALPSVQPVPQGPIFGLVSVWAVATPRRLNPISLTEEIPHDSQPRRSAFTRRRSERSALCSFKKV